MQATISLLFSLESRKLPAMRAPGTFRSTTCTACSSAAFSVPTQHSSVHPAGGKPQRVPKQSDRGKLRGLP